VSKYQHFYFYNLNDTYGRACTSLDPLVAKKYG